MRVLTAIRIRFFIVLRTLDKCWLNFSYVVFGLMVEKNTFVEKYSYGSIVTVLPLVL
jgi:hypothetical protein